MAEVDDGGGGGNPMGKCKIFDSTLLVLPGESS